MSDISYLKILPHNIKYYTFWNNAWRFHTSEKIPNNVRYHIIQNICQQCQINHISEFFLTMSDISCLRIFPYIVLYLIFQNKSQQWQTFYISCFRIYLHNVNYFIFQNFSPQCQIFPISEYSSTMWDVRLKHKNVQTNHLVPGDQLYVRLAKYSD